MYSKVVIHEPLIAGGMGGPATIIGKTAQSILSAKAHQCDCSILPGDFGTNCRIFGFENMISNLFRG